MRIVFATGGSNSEIKESSSFSAGAESLFCFDPAFEMGTAIASVLDGFDLPEAPFTVFRVVVFGVFVLSIVESSFAEFGFCDFGFVAVDFLAIASVPFEFLELTEGQKQFHQTRNGAIKDIYLNGQDC